jgi:hypothetical protein
MADRDVETVTDRIKEGRRVIAIEEKGRLLPRELD